MKFRNFDLIQFNSADEKQYILEYFNKKNIRLENAGHEQSSGLFIIRQNVGKTRYFLAIPKKENKAKANISFEDFKKRIQC